MTERAYFDELYASSPDPWDLATRAYELRKYDLTVASLPRARYRRAFEPGCSVGLLTRLLVERCDEVVASDLVAAPLVLAAERAPAATFRRGGVPDDWPPGRLDLVVLSELLYYLSAADRAATIERARESLDPGGHLVAVHWRHPFVEAACDGDTAHAEIRRDPTWRVLVEHVEPDFRLEVLERGAD
ncbi:MAG: class I SAM-dependent methyltransferase [Aeromicrobium sp.]